MEEIDVVKRFQDLFERKEYKEASELAVESIEITGKYLEELQIERDTAVKQKDEISKKLEEVRKTGVSPPPTGGDVVNRAEFSYQELSVATNNFDKKKKIREGAFGIVYEGSLLTIPVAIKIVKQSEGGKEFDHEVRTLSKVSHPNLVSLIGVHSSPNVRAIVYEFVPHGSLETYLPNAKKPNQPLSWQNRIRIASDICSALIFLHSIKPNGIVHGNLNPENILLDSNMVCKLSDFGMSRELDQTSETKTKYYQTCLPHGLMCYMDPVYGAYHDLTKKSDVYSFGIILLQLVTGKRPHNINHVVEKAMSKKQLDKELDASAGKWPINEVTELASLGLACSSTTRTNRPDLAEEVLPKINAMKHAANLH